MTKGKLILIIIVLIAIFSTIFYLNYDNIINFIDNKEWEYVSPIAKILTNKYLQASSAGDELIVIESDKISAYTNSSVSDFTVTNMLRAAISDDVGDYSVVGEAGGSKFILLNEKGKVWEFDTQGEILALSVNKNGYVACIYSKNGYKSLIKVIKPNGEEMFTNYLASTYAVDVEISNDNKYLALAEVNAEGINMESSVKIIDMNKAEAEAITTVKLDSNTLVLDIEYNDKNELLVLEDNRIEKVSSAYEKTTIRQYRTSEVSHISIENKSNFIMVEKEETGIFSTNYVLKIYDLENTEPKSFELDSTPKQIYAQGKVIAVDLGNEILFLNTNGRFLKHCRLDGQVKEIKLYGNGSMAALVFRDRIEIIKL